MSETPLLGGCLCGAVRYSARGPVTRVNHCHCSQCRRTSGAVAATWAKVPLAGFAVVAGRPASYRSSDFATRAFCAVCGSTLFWQRDNADAIDLAVGSLDDAAGLEATRHYFVEGRLAGFSLDPHVPEFPGT